MNRFAPIASDDFIIMMPDGMLETKQEDIDGAKKFRGVHEIFQCHRAYARQNGGCHRATVARSRVGYKAKTSCGGPGWLAGCWLE